MTCHQQEAVEWRASRHHLSNTNDAYRTALAVEPSTFCRGCHAPESIMDGRDESAQLNDLGVGCVTCHLTDASGIVLSAISAAPQNAPQPGRAVGRVHDHRSRAEVVTSSVFPVSPVMTRGTSCRARCASMPAPLPRPRRAPRATCRRSVRVDDHTRFAEVRDPEWLRANLQAQAERAGDDAVRITLRQPAPGHAFPSGDLFAASRSVSRIVRFRDGHFDAVPDLERPIVNTFVGVRGELHASDGEVIYRLERDAWTCRRARKIASATATELTSTEA